MNKVLDEAVGFVGKKIIRYNWYMWISYFSKLEFFKYIISYIEHHNLKSIKIINGKKNFFKVTYWVCTLSPAYTTIKSKGSLTPIMKVWIVYLKRQYRKHKTENDSKQCISIKNQNSPYFILALWCSYFSPPPTFFFFA